MLTRFIFTLTLFGSAFLSFSIQPLLGKMLLPIVGGAPSGWIVAMAFFQLALLGGYFLSHILQRVPPLTHGLVLLILYGVGLLTLPATVTAIDTALPLGVIVFIMLAKTILLPFTALTATTSALLRIFSQTDQPTAQDPYYLFTASNAGSLIGLFIYPLALEPFFGLTTLSHLWFSLYGIMLALIAGCVIIARFYRSTTVPSQTVHRDTSPVNSKALISWFCLAFVPCSLSMSLSTMMTTDIANFPLIWALPLGCYLLSFILGFARRPLIKLDTLQFLHLVSAGLLFIFLFIRARGYGLNMNAIVTDVFLLSALFLVICWSCHQTLAAERPAANHVTLYYLIIAFGGAAAGMLNAFILPLVLDRIIEFHGSVLLSLCLPMMWRKQILPSAPRLQTIIFTTLLILGLMMLGAYYYTLDMDTPVIQTYKMVARSLIVICLLVLIFKPRHLIVAGMAITAFCFVANSSGQSLLHKRNFFGSMIVSDISAGNLTIRTLRHGNTTHGLAEYRNGVPTGNLAYSYYVPNGPLHDVYALTQPHNVAILGLGTGQLACFPHTMKLKETQTTYFEIDPDMVAVSKQFFPYLDHCPVHNIVLGDARLEFAKQTDRYDLLILDVFSSDSIPVHIVTTEALQMYPRHMTPDGVMMFHISNRYLNLAPQIAASVKALGLPAYVKYHQPPAQHMFALASQWVAIPLDQAKGQTLLKEGWTAIDPGQTMAWTDDQSSLLSALRPVANRISVTQDFVK